MKAIFLAFCGCLIIFGANDALAGSSLTLNPKCAAGPTFWCDNIQNAKSCGAMTHCIKTNSWKKYPVDNDSICHICLDMVKQARDQLRSNETQEELREVFEGTCALIRIKKIREECDKLADSYEAQLVEMLTSEMDPQLVCSVAGLCNSAKIDAELAKTPNAVAVAVPIVNDEIKPKSMSCEQCGKVSNLIATKFSQTSRDQFLENLLGFCGQMSSLSDGCSAIVIAYFNDIYAHLKENLNSENICHMAGACVKRFHQHEDEIEVVPYSEFGFVDDTSDDIPCDLCKQLIMHLRDLLVANTTEIEFKNVLEGICKQTKTFKAECLSIADQYFDVIYNKLTKELNPEATCFQVGMCPKGLTNQQKEPQLISPLIPSQLLLVKMKIELGKDEPLFSTEEIQGFQLPKDVLLLDADQIQSHVYQQKSNQFCTLCEYFLHFVQDALASPSNEEAIKDAVLNSCHKFPKQIQGQCQSFVNMYGDAVIALLIQDLDPSEICPRLAVCVRTTPRTNEKCPLCLFLVQDLVELIKRDKSKKNIENKLQTLCSRLRDDLKAECIDFVNTYTAELVDKLANDFTPRDICLYLKLCTEKEEILIEHIGSHSSYNNYISNSVYEIEDMASGSDCFICERVIKEAEKKISNDKSKDHIKKVLEQACSDLPGAHLKQKCKTAIEKNSDFIVDLLVKEVTPKEVCIALGFCILEAPKVVEIVPMKVECSPCHLCEIVVAKMEKILNNKTDQQDVENCVKHVCLYLPKKLRPKCRQLIDEYAAEIVKHFPSSSPKKLCTDAWICKRNEFDEESSEEGSSKEDSSEEMVEIVPMKADSPQCHLCQIIVAKMEKELNNKTDQEDVENCIKHVCSDLPKNMRPKCRQLIDEYAAEIVKHFPSSSPKKLCTDACICKKTEFEEESSEEDDDGSSPECMLCENLVHKVEEKVKMNKSKDHIEEVLKQVCSTFRKEHLKEKCNEVVDKKIDYIIDEVVKNSSPKEICHGLGFCDGKRPQDDKAIELIADRLMTKYSETPQCVICELVMTKLEADLKKNATIVEIEQAFQRVCSVFPRIFSGICKKFVADFADLIISMASTVSPSDLCGQINICLSNSSKDTAHRDILECGICNTAVDALSTVLSKNGPKDRDNVAETTCRLLPARYYETCHDFMQIYVESLINLMGQNVKRSEICVKVGKCFQNGDNSMFVEINEGLSKLPESHDSSESDESSADVPTHKMRLVGASPCSFGPSYWCSSQETIDECKAHKYCNKQAKLP